jgi:uncharacterized protein (DUF885 family)
VPFDAPERAPASAAERATAVARHQALRGGVVAARVQVERTRRRLEYLEKTELKPGEVLYDMRGKTARTTEQVREKVRVEKERLATAEREEQARRAGATPGAPR